MTHPIEKTVTLSGHLIDSLTLAKVIDVIESHQCEFEVDDLHIGRRKADLSDVTLQIFAPDEATFQTLLDALSVYGAKLVSAA